MIPSQRLPPEMPMQNAYGLRTTAAMGSAVWMISVYRNYNVMPWVNTIARQTVALFIDNSNVGALSEGQFSPGLTH